MADSATGGPLLPNVSAENFLADGFSIQESLPAPAPLEGQALLRLLQGWAVGITGLPGNLIRPFWQGSPPDIPDAGVAWVALGVRSRASETFPVVLHIGSAASGLGGDELNRYEKLDLLFSFYDLGATAPAGHGGMADYYASLMRDGVEILQNLELLQLNDMGFSDVGPLTGVPTLVKDRWQYRVDLSIGLERHIVRRYPVRNIVEAVATLSTRFGNIDGIPADGANVADTGIV